MSRPALFSLLLLAFTLAAWAWHWRRAVIATVPTPELRLSWSGGAAAAAAVGEWDGWANALPLVHSRGILHTAVVRLSAECPRALLVSRQICCYRYAFRLGRTPADAARSSQLRADPRQPTDIDAQGRITNIACVSAGERRTADAGPGSDAQPAALSAGGGTALTEMAPSLGNQSAVALARANGKPLPCVQLASSTWEAGGAGAAAPLRRLRAPTWAHCCDACLRHEGCAGFNWRLRGADDGCALLARGALGRLRATLAVSAGVAREAVPAVAQAAVVGGA